MTEGLMQALAAVRAGDRDRAHRIAVGESSSLLGRALTTYLETHGDTSGSVYTEPSAFQAFIAGGGNRGLYSATAGALARTWERTGARSVLDIGTGDGAALIPALTWTTHRPESVEIVELSPALLAAARDRLRELDVESSAHPATAQEFTRSLRDDQQWDVVQSTFALHALPPAEREEVLRALREHVRELVLVEFDVPELTPGTDEHLRFLATSYEEGLSEYGPDRDQVAQGFLIPVLIGQLSPDAARMTYEQTAAQWARQLARCGYERIDVTALYPYWSSPAFVLTAHGSAAPTGAVTGLAP